MTRAVSLILLLALAGCASTEGPGDAVIPDDDDATANDDDATANDDDATAPDDDDTTQDDLDVGDDDDSGAGAVDVCAVEDLLPTVCTALTSRTLTLDLPCPVGAYMASDAITWAALLAQCGVGTDPLVGHDWSAESVVGFVDAASGCDAQAEVLWAVECAGRAHIAEAFVACGDCAAVPSAGAWSAIPAGTLPLDSRVRCVPDDLACE